MRTDVREMPGAFGDPFRAIEARPGVVPLTGGLPYFYIRGAPPNNNGYYVDGIRVALLFHVGGIGQGVIHPALIDHVDFCPGAAPASYGGFAGATIAGQTREPATRSHGEANLRVLDAGALVEETIDDGRLTVLAAGRYGYPGPILSAITSNVSIDYWAELGGGAGNRSPCDRRTPGNSRKGHPTRVDVSARERVAFGPNKMPVEDAVARAIEGAVAADRWDVVAQLARKLEARRRDTAGVVGLGTERSRRGHSRRG